MNRPVVTSIGYKRVCTRAMHLLAYCLCLVGLSLTAIAQQADTSGKTQVHILRNDQVIYTKTDTGTYYRFIGNVIMQQGTDTLYCDSLYENETSKLFEAFSNVRVAQQGGTQATSNYLNYNSHTKETFMSGNVSLVDSGNTLKCEQLTYNLDTKTAVYSNGGTLHNDSTTVTSNSGVYNVRDKQAHFTGNVVITDPRYNIKSEDLVYNTATKVTTFYAKSVVTSDSGRSVLKTTRGSYDSKNVIAHFIGRSSIWNDGQYLEADTIHYNKTTGFGFADGNVISIDTGRKSTLYCGHTEYFRKKRALWATIKPVLVQVNGKDTFYLRADTLYSAPMEMQLVKGLVSHESKARLDSIVVSADLPDTAAVRKKSLIRKLAKADATNRELKDTVAVKDIPVIKKAQDTLWVVPAYKYRMPDFRNDTVMNVRELYKKTKRRKGAEAQQTVVPDDAPADTSAPLFFTGYHHVLIFSDSMQAKCDSVCYTRSDSTIRLIINPIAWSRKSQITGDTILMHMDSNTIRSMYVPNNAFMVSQSGPDKARLYNQVQGKTLTAYFADNALTKMVTFPNAEAIYYSIDEKGAYLGVAQTKSDRIRIFFDNQKISSLKLEPENHETMTPLDKADLPNMKLSRFKWLIDQRPKSKEELFQ